MELPRPFVVAALAAVFFAGSLLLLLNVGSASDLDPRSVADGVPTATATPCPEGKIVIGLFEDCGTRTPTPDNCLGCKMSLEVSGTDGSPVTCDSKTGSVENPAKCTLTKDSTFTVEIVANAIPPGGYTSFITVLFYGDLLYKPTEFGADEVVWTAPSTLPVRFPSPFIDGTERIVGHGDITAFFNPPSHFGVEPLVQLEMNCQTQSPSEGHAHDIVLLARVDELPYKFNVQNTPVPQSGLFTGPEGAAYVTGSDTVIRLPILGTVNLDLDGDTAIDRSVISQNTPTFAFPPLAETPTPQPPNPGVNLIEYPVAAIIEINCGNVVPATDTPIPTLTPSATPTDTPTRTPTLTPTPCPGEKVPLVSGECGTPTPSPVCSEGKVPFGNECGTPTDTPTATPTCIPDVEEPVQGGGCATHTPTPTSVPELADLVVTKNHSPASPASGETIAYSVEVRNNGNIGAANVVMRDALPANFVFTTVTAVRPSTVCNHTGGSPGGTVECTIDSLGTGMAAFDTIVIEGTITAASGKNNVSNTAEADPDGAIEESDEANNSAKDTLNVAGATATPPPTAVPTAPPGSTDAPGFDSNSGFVPAGGMLTTDKEGDGATPDDPVETSVTVHNGGDVSITEKPTINPDPLSFSLLGIQVNINAPPADSQNPLEIVFTLDGSFLPEGVDETNVKLFRNGIVVPDCLAANGKANPDPCIAKRHSLVGSAAGDIQLRVLTSTASSWNFGILLPPDGTPLGDVDGSGEVNSLDAFWILALKGDFIGGLPFPSVADVNQDALIDVIDALLILQFDAGFVDTLPPSVAGAEAPAAATLYLRWRWLF